MPKWIAYIVGKFIGNKLNLQEDTKMDGTKSRWLSKGVWTGIVTTLLGVYALVSTVLMPALGHAPLPAVPDWILTILGTLGIYSRMTATEKLK